MSASSSPPAGLPEPTGWRWILGWPRRLWRSTDAVADDVADALGIPVAGFRRRAARPLFFALMLVMMPLVWPLRRLFHSTAERRVRDRSDEIWQTNPYEAVALVESVCLQVRAAVPSDKLLARIDLPPWGRFTPFQLAQLESYLFRCYLAVGRYEDALTLCRAFGEAELFVQMQVDCLIAMKRTPDAIALLRDKLHLDGPRGKLRSKLESLTGSSAGRAN